MSRTWTNGGPPFLNADNLNALEADVAAALGFGNSVTAPAFGAKNDGSVDASAAIQAAHDALPTNGGRIVFPRGKYLVNSTITISKPVTLIGEGSGDHAAGAGALNTGTTYAPTSQGSVVFTTSGTLEMFNVTASGFGTLDIAFVNTSGTTPTAGAGLRIQRGEGLKLTRTRFAGFWNNASIEQYEFADITDCLNIDPVNYGLWIRNLVTGDQGDMTIKGGAFSFSGSVNRTAAAAVRWESGGGVKFHSKVNMGPRGGVGKFAQGLDFAVADGVSTSVLTITGASIENTTTTGIRLTRSGTTGSFKYITITGNEFANDLTAIDIQAGATTGTIGGNVFGGMTTGINFGNTGGWNVLPNTFSSVTSPVVVGSLAGYVRVAPQTIATLGNVVADTSTGHLQANVDYNYGTPIPSTTGATVNTLFRLAVPIYSVLDMEFRATGSVSGVGEYGFVYRRTLRRGASGAVTVTTPTGWTDVALGTTPPTVTLDTAAVTGEVQIKIQLGGGGTDVFGLAQVQVSGQLASFRIGP